MLCNFEYPIGLDVHFMQIQRDPGPEANPAKGPKEEGLLILFSYPSKQNKFLKRCGFKILTQWTMFKILVKLVTYLAQSQTHRPYTSIGQQNVAPYK